VQVGTLVPGDLPTTPWRSSNPEGTCSMTVVLDRRSLFPLGGPTEPADAA
jgi:hypothetical protein